MQQKHTVEACAPVYPNGTLGVSRELGINELLLHHHMTDALQLFIH